MLVLVLVLVPTNLAEATIPFDGVFGFLLVAGPNVDRPTWKQMSRAWMSQRIANSFVLR